MPAFATTDERGELPAIHVRGDGLERHIERLRDRARTRTGMLDQIPDQVVLRDPPRLSRGSFTEQHGTCGPQPLTLRNRRLMRRELAVQLRELLIDVRYETPRSPAQHTTRTTRHDQPPNLRQHKNMENTVLDNQMTIKSGSSPPGRASAS